MREYKASPLHRNCDSSTELELRQEDELGPRRARAAERRPTHRSSSNLYLGRHSVGSVRDLDGLVLQAGRDLAGVDCPGVVK